MAYMVAGTFRICAKPRRGGGVKVVSYRYETMSLVVPGRRRQSQNRHSILCDAPGLLAVCSGLLPHARGSASGFRAAGLDGRHVLRQRSGAATRLGSTGKRRSGALEAHGGRVVVPRGSCLLSATADSGIIGNKPNVPGVRQSHCLAIHGCGLIRDSRCVRKSMAASAQERIDQTTRISVTEGEPRWFGKTISP